MYGARPSSWERNSSIVQESELSFADETAQTLFRSRFSAFPKLRNLVSFGLDVLGVFLASVIYVVRSDEANPLSSGANAMSLRILNFFV